MVCLMALKMVLEWVGWKVETMETYLEQLKAVMLEIKRAKRSESLKAEKKAEK